MPRKVSLTEEKQGRSGVRLQNTHLWLGEPAQSPSCGYLPVKKFLSDGLASSIFDSIGGPVAASSYALSEVEVKTGLRGQVMGIEFRR